jgi:hypothetical protein
MGTEFFQLHATRRVPTIFHGRIAGHTVRSLIGVRATFGAFQGNNQSDPFLAGHGSTVSLQLRLKTQLTIFAYDSGDLQADREFEYLMRSPADFAP